MIRRTHLLAVLSIIAIVLTSCLAPLASVKDDQADSKTVSDDDLQPLGNSQIISDDELLALREYMYPSETPQISFEKVKGLKYGMTDAEVADAIGCYGKLCGSGVLMRLYNIDESQQIRLNFRSTEFNVERLHSVEIFSDGIWAEYDLK